MQTKNKTREMVYIALMVALTAVCSWINIPYTVPFTMQTFAVFAALELLGGKNGMIMTAVYLLMGAVGLPVFAGFAGGFDKLLGTTGGYLIGFVAQAGIYWFMTAKLGKGRWIRIAALVIGLAACYAFGTVWFVTVYTRNSGAVSVMTALGWCVFPYIVPDLVKMALALVLTERIKKALGDRI